MTSARDRRVAAASAGHTGDEEAARAALVDEDAGVRAAASGALARLGALTIDDARVLLADPAAEVRRRAAECSIQLDIDLIRLLGDPDPSVAEAAAFARGEREHDASPIPALAKMSQQHENDLCRESAVAALGALAANPDADQTAVIDALLRALDDKATIRRRAIIGLHQFTDDSAEAAVRAALDDRDRQVRALAADLLGVPPD